MIINLLLLISIITVQAQICRNQQGEPVQWWVVLKIPPKNGNTGYAYIDSRSSIDQFTYISKELDKDITALTNTLRPINEKNLTNVAWNDEKPSGQTSSTSAHSKGLIVVDTINSIGLFLSHSIPKYPQIIDRTINPQIFPSEQVYGQHLSCFTLTLSELDRIAANLLTTKLFIYHSSIPNTYKTQNLYRLGQGIVVKHDQSFIMDTIKSALGYQIKSIYKNDLILCDIFQDGLVNYLQSTPLIAQTWGRPLQPAWCLDPYQVKNVLVVQITETISWRESEDHSKWVLAGDNYACFGDMNRMNSQAKRGGAFYCLSQPKIVKALKSVIALYDQCSQKKLRSQ